jgi:cation-transporting ATPase 13A3/4/5
MFQYMTLAIVYSTGIPYRKPLFNNWPLCTSLAILSVVSAYIVLEPPAFIISFLEFDPIPYFGFRLFLLMLAFLSGVVSYIYERWFIEYMISGVRERSVFGLGITVAVV